MAKIAFKDPADAATIDASGDDLYVRDSQVIQRRKATKPGPITTPRSTATQLMVSLEHTYQALSPTQKATWTTYKAHVGESKHAWNAMFANNMHLLYPSIPGKTPILSITSPPQNPTTPLGFCAAYLTNSDAISVGWCNTYTLETYVQAFQWILPGRRRSIDRPWDYITYALSSDEHLDIPGTELLAGARSIIAVRALNTRGEVSGSPTAEEIPIPDAPVPDFSASPRSGFAPLTVQFTDLSSGTILAHDWHFGDDETSAQQNPEHQYALAGFYSPELILHGPGNTRPSETKENYIIASTYTPQDWFWAKEHRDDIVGNSATDERFKIEGDDIWIYNHVAKAGCGYLFASFNATWLHGKFATVRWRAPVNNNNFKSKLWLRDGAFERFNPLDFPDKQKVSSKGQGIIGSITKSGNFPWQERTLLCNTDTCQFSTATLMIGFQQWANAFGQLYIDWFRIKNADGDTLVNTHFDNVWMEIQGTYADYGYTTGGDFP